MSDLTPLDQHNDDRRRVIMTREPIPTGLACPVCGSEMHYANDGQLLLSNPKMVNVLCVCGHRDRMIAR